MPEVLVHVLEARNLPFVSDGDVYPLIRVQKEKTKGKKVKLSNTVWNQFYLVSFKAANPLTESVYINLNTHKTLGKDVSIGECRIPLETVYQGVETQNWYPVYRVGDGGAAQIGEINVGLSGVDFGGLNPNASAYPDEAPLDFRGVSQGVPPPMMPTSGFEDGQGGSYNNYNNINNNTLNNNPNAFPSMGSPTMGPSTGYYAPPPTAFPGAAPPRGAAPTASSPDNKGYMMYEYPVGGRGVPVGGYPYAQQFQAPNGQTVFIVAPPPAAAPAGPQRCYIVEEPLTPEQLKKLRRKKRWRKALRITGVVLLGLLTAATFVLIGMWAF